MPEPANTAPLPQGGAYLDPALTLLNKQQDQGYADLIRYATRTDPQVNALLAYGAMLRSKGNAAEATSFIGSNTGKYTRDAIGLLANWGMFGNGSPAALAMGIRQSMAASVPRVDTAGYGFRGAAQIYGGGSIVDQMSKKVIDTVQQQYFTRAGLPNSNTFGFNRTQMGDIFSLMGQRGMLNGMINGKITPSTIPGQEGKMEMALSPRSVEQIKKNFESTAELLASMRALMGDKSIAELAQQAEKYAGMSLRGNDPRAIKDRIERVRTTARNMGVDEKGLLDLHANLSAMATGTLGASAASAASITATRAGLMTANAGVTAANLARSNGRFLRTYGQEEVAAANVAGVSSILEENPALAEAAYIAQTMASGPEKEAITRALSSYQNATDKKSRQEAITKVQAAAEKVSGVTTGSITRALGGTKNVLSGLDPEEQSKLMEVVMGNEVGRNRDLLAQLAQGTGAGRRAGLNARTAGDMAFAFARGFDADTQEAIISALSQGDAQGAQQILQNNAKLLEESGFSKQQIAGLGNAIARDPAKMGQFFREMQANISATPMLKNMRSVMDERRAAQIEAADYVYRNTIGDENLPQHDLITTFAKGILGGKQVDDQMVMDLLANRRSGITSVKRDGAGLSMTAEQAAQFQAITAGFGDGGIAKALGIGVDNSAAIAAALSTPEGFNKFAAFAKANKMALASDNQGNLLLADKGSADKARRDLDAAARAREIAVLRGVDLSTSYGQQELKSIEGKVRVSMIAEDTLKNSNDPKARANMSAAIRKSTQDQMQSLAERITSARGVEFFKSMFNQTGKDDITATGGVNAGSDSFDTLKRLYKRDSAATEAMLEQTQRTFERQAEAGGPNAANSKRRAEQIKELRERLKDGGNTARLVVTNSNEIMIEIANRVYEQIQNKT